MKTNHVYCGDALKVLKNFPDESIDCCITSPPYYGLRDYGVENQIGTEDSPEKYVNSLIAVFLEVKRVLKKHGTLWLNLGDSYAGSNQGKGNYKKFSDLQKSNKGSFCAYSRGDSLLARIKDYKPKDMLGIPWTIALNLRDRLGLYLRQDIIWVKPNPMPESVKDRCTKSHEYIFLLSKSKKYYFDSDAIKEKANEKSTLRYNSQFNTQIKETIEIGKVNLHSNIAKSKKFTEYRNKRDVWVISPKGYKGAHFATFPQELISPCILAGCPESGIVLDPFFGSGTVGVVAKQLNRNYVGIDLNEDYCKLAEERIKNGGN